MNKHVAFLQIGEQAGQVARFLDGWTAGAFEVGAHGLGDDVGQGGLAQSGRSAEQDVIQGFVALLGRLDGDFQPLLDLGLTGEIGEQRRPQRHLQRCIRLGQNI